MASDPKPQNQRPPGKKKSRGGRPRLGVVALSSAAVMAVYSAGFMRTRDAARRFDQQDAARARAVALPAAPPFGQPVPAPPADPAQPAEAASRPTPSYRQLDSASPSGAPAPETPAPDPAPADAASTPAPAPSAFADADAGAGTLNIATPDAAPAPAPTPAPAQPAPVAALYKDGTYTGWGSCRHGDIQAQVIVADGRVTSATIISCLTRYSCSWIAALPPEVVTRQSANVDYVTGATQSSDAFYYAIAQALSKAK